VGDLVQFGPRPKKPKVVWEAKSSMTEWRIVFEPFDKMYRLQKRGDTTWWQVTSSTNKEDLIKKWVKYI